MIDPKRREPRRRRVRAGALQRPGPRWLRQACLRTGTVVILAAVASPASTLSGQEANGGLFPPSPASDQPVRELSLDEALEVARLNNPGYLQDQEATAAADWRVRESYGSFLPTFDVGGTLRYEGEGQQLIGTLTGDELGAGSTHYLFSSYRMTANLSVSGSEIFGLASSRANQRAAVARAAASAYSLESRVTQQYLAALRATEAMVVSLRLFDRADENLELARVRAAAGAVAGTDALQAEVERGRAAVAVVRAENVERVEHARLLAQMGVLDDRPLELVSSFQVFDPEPILAELAPNALDAHPRLRALREAESARSAGLRQAQSSYLPSLSLSASLSGFAREIGNEDFLIVQRQNSLAGQRQNCEFFNAISFGLSSPLDGYPRDCDQFVLTPESEAAILAGNDVFPFEFERSPLSLSLSINFPLFRGLSRQRSVEESAVSLRAAQHATRAEELQLRTEVTTAAGNLGAAWQVVQIEEQNRALAQQQLDYAQQRYGLGAAPLLELLDAQSSAATAERDYLNAVYDFHGALVDLESVSGLELRPDVDLLGSR